MFFDRRFLIVNLTIAGIANEPAANPVEGTQYIVGSEGTGAFADAAANSIARYDGTSWTFTAPKVGALEVLNEATGEILRYTGTAWEPITILGDKFVAPVLDIVPSGDTLPASAEEGDKFLNTDDAKIYTATAEDTWDSGTALSEGDRYASSTDFQIYTYEDDALVEEAIVDNALFVNKADNCIYVYDTEANAITRTGAPQKDTTTVEAHTAVAADITNKSFTLTNSIKAGHESEVILFLGGVALTEGKDFTASGNTISWTGKTIENFSPHVRG